MLLILAIIAVIVWIVNSYLPISSKRKTVANIIAVIGLFVWLSWIVLPMIYHRLFPPPPAPPSLNY